MPNIFKVLREAIFPSPSNAVVEYVAVTRALDRFSEGGGSPEDIATLDAYLSDKPVMLKQFHERLARRQEQRDALAVQMAAEDAAWEREMQQDEDERLQLLAEVQNLKARLDRVEQEHKED